MPTEPSSSNGLRPIRSMDSTVMVQATMLKPPEITLMSSASDSENPTDCQSTAP